MGAKVAIQKIALFSAILFTALLVVPLAVAESALVLEAEQHWETYGEGGTCIPGQHNLAVADIDGDGTQEMVTGGYAYDVLPNGTRTFGRAPLKIWSWNGQNITLEHSENWKGNIGVVFAGDVDGDSKIEIVTSGGKENSTGSVAGTLCLWNWNNQTLSLKGSYQGIAVNSLIAADVNDDQRTELLTVGRTFSSRAQLAAWKWSGTELALQAKVECCDANGTANSVFSGDIDGDGTIEVATAGYTNGFNASKGQLRIWKINGDTFSMQASTEWQMVEGTMLNSAGNPQGNTMVNSVKIADVDGDGVSEIVTGGFTYDGVKVDGQLRVWNFSGQALNLELSHEYSALGITELKTVALGDADNDGKLEIVASGGTVGYSSFSANSTEKETAQLRVWSWDGKTLTEKQSEDWVIGEGVMAWNGAVADLEGDGKNEILTVGCMYVGNLCDPDMRIWSIQNTTNDLFSAQSMWSGIIVAGVLLAVVIAVLIVVIIKRRSHQKEHPTEGQSL